MRITPILAMALGLATWATPAPAGHSNALWHVVHDLCVTDARLTGLAAPCMAVSREGRYAVLKDLSGRTQVLLIPTDKVTGIEAPVLLSEGSPNYWQAAWRARRFFERQAGGAVDRDDVALVINSSYGRSQDQLHIHIDCVQPAVKAALAAHSSQIGLAWAPFPEPLENERYIVRRLVGEDLSAHDPFKLLAEYPEARADMGAWTLVVIGGQFDAGAPGFYLLAARGGVPANPLGAGEDLMDHACAVLRAGGRPA